jgi:quinol monooxygenase YgiN
MIVVEANFVLADASRRDEAIAATVPWQRATREEEPGCLVYCFAPDPVCPGVVQVYELWEDEASLAAHFEHVNYLTMRTVLGKIGLASASSRKLRVDATAPVYGPGFVPSASFDM